MARAIIRKHKLLPEDPVATTLTLQEAYVLSADARNSGSLRSIFRPLRAQHICLIPALSGADRIRESERATRAVD